MARIAQTCVCISMCVCACMFARKTCLYVRIWCVRHGTSQINSILNCSNTPINKNGRQTRYFADIFKYGCIRIAQIEAYSSHVYTLTCPFDTSLKINIAE